MEANKSLSLSQEQLAPGDDQDLGVCEALADSRRRVIRDWDGVQESAFERM